MKNLKLRKMGCDFMTDADRRASDCGNHRLRAEFTDRDGKRVTADFEGGRIWNDLCISASYHDENGVCHPYLPLERRQNFRYRLADILKAVNSVSEEQYDNVEVTE